MANTSSNLSTNNLDDDFRLVDFDPITDLFNSIFNIIFIIVIIYIFYIIILYILSLFNFIWYIINDTISFRILL